MSCPADIGGGMRLVLAAIRHSEIMRINRTGQLLRGEYRLASATRTQILAERFLAHREKQAPP
jgi:hypothetical protein